MNLLNILKRKDKQEIAVDDFLPHSLKIGSFIKFDEVEFSNIGLDSKFIFEGFDNIVQAVGIYKIAGIKHVNIYLESQNGFESYLTIAYDQDEKNIVECKLFKFYDEIFPQSEEEWLYWIGNDNVQGIMNDETFVIEDEPIEKIGELLFKLTRRLYPEFKDFSDTDFDDLDSCISTNLFSKISRDLKVDYDEVIEKFDKQLENCDWIVEIIKNDEDDNIVEIYFILTESDLDIEYTNYYQVNNSIDYDEIVYTGISDESTKEYSKKNMIFSRSIQDEFFNEEYININIIEDGQGTHISLDIGIPISLTSLGI